MKVILLEKVYGIGDFGNIVSVKDGYARNFLIPKNKALLANKENIAEFELKKADLEILKSKKIELVRIKAEKLNNISLFIKAKVHDENLLFGSIGPKEICEKIELDYKVKVEKKELVIKNGTIHELGEYEASIIFDFGVTSKITISVISE